MDPPKTSSDNDAYNVWTPLYCKKCYAVQKVDRWYKHGHFVLCVLKCYHVRYVDAYSLDGAPPS